MNYLDKDKLTNATNKDNKSQDDGSKTPTRDEQEDKEADASVIILHIKFFILQVFTYER